SQRLRRVVEQSCLRRGVFELAIAQIVPKANRCALVRLRRAVRLVRAVKRAVDIALRAPLDVVDDDEVELAVAVVVEPGRAGTELVRAPHARGLRYIGKRAVAVVVEEMALSKRGNVDVLEAVVV